MKIYKKVVILAALAREELPEFEVVCGETHGPCWKRGYLCYKGEYWGYNCERTSDPRNNCSYDC